MGELAFLHWEAGAECAGQRLMQRDPAIGQGSITVAQSCGEACKANRGCGCNHRYVWLKCERGICRRQGFWSGGCCGKTHGSHGDEVLRRAARSEVRWGKEQRKAGGPRSNQEPKLLMLSLGDVTAGWLALFGCFGNKESRARK